MIQTVAQLFSDSCKVINREDWIHTSQERKQGDKTLAAVVTAPLGNRSMGSPLLMAVATTLLARSRSSARPGRPSYKTPLPYRSLRNVENAILKHFETNGQRFELHGPDNGRALLAIAAGA
jgi:hypothetical protein